MTNAPLVLQPTRWAAQASEDVEELDEPPELQLRKTETKAQNFHRAPIKRANDQSSLLTRAIMGQPGDDSIDSGASTFVELQRRRSLNSNVSIASTADLTSDTGLTSPARTNTPSPPIPDIAVLRLNGHSAQPSDLMTNKESVAPQEAPRKRCIQFACPSKQPGVQQEATLLRPPPMQKAPSAMEAPRRPCIKFACDVRPASTQNTPPRRIEQSTGETVRAHRATSPSTPRKSPNPTGTTTLRRPSNQTRSRPKFFRASSKDMVNDASQFHEFASGVKREEDWIRQDSSPVKARLTINDTLSKENDIRRLAAEAEEEAELEDEAEEAALDDEDEDEDEDDEDEEEDEDEDDEDEDEEDDDDDDFTDSDGYHTDEETGFAESETDEDDDDDNMILWTPGRAQPLRLVESVIPAMRRPSLQEQHSDSSAASQRSVVNARTRRQRARSQSDAPDLPDSTDFVCGTLDEDRPLEEAYLSCMAARRNEKLRVIPQDIDPSFPASDPEDEQEEQVYNPVHHGSDEEEWMQGKMEDLHHGQDRSRKRRQSEHHSPRKFRSPPPKKFHSPPPKRMHSPPPKPRARARSPKPLFERRSPRRMRSPAARGVMTTPTGSLRQGGTIAFHLGGRPGLTHTKSLPRPAAMFGAKCKGLPKLTYDDDIHIRGAIDIVKGLERKRQRRKEKFHQKYCNRARRGQIPERKPQPGKGAERMKELGLLMAGKKDQGDYVLSV